MPRPRIATDSNLYSLPVGVPAPHDDGAAAHLLGVRVPHVELPSTGGGKVDVGAVSKSLSVFFVYPATIAPPAVIPGEWSEIPGARGCTIENIGFREAYPMFAANECRVFGVSGQGRADPAAGLAEQLELKERLGLPFDLLNDSTFELARALKLPTFVASLKNPTIEFEGRLTTFPLQGKTLLRRLTFVADRGRVEKVFYPVFPPGLNGGEVLDYVRQRGSAHPS